MRGLSTVFGGVKKADGPPVQVYPLAMGKPRWSGQNYAALAQNAYAGNAVAYRCIRDIAVSASSAPVIVYSDNPAIERLLKRPCPGMGRVAFFESVYHQLLIAGNAYIEAVVSDEAPQELWVLRSDRVQVMAGASMIAKGYTYSMGQKKRVIPVDQISGHARLLHLRHYHPLDDWYGLSPLAAARTAIDQFNQAAHWNQALLQNGCRPSGALVVEGGESGQLSEGQYARLREELEQKFAGAANAGRPLLLEGGLKWVDMMLSPKDMDFMNIKHTAARDIALALGYPPILLGIPGDSTYSNQKEARLALWEQTVLPLAAHVLDGLAHWLSVWFGADVRLELDEDAISALNPRRDLLWERIGKADFLTDAEKRAAVGFE